MKLYEDYIHQSKYARYLDEQQRRESWDETVSRYVDYWVDKGLIAEEDIADIGTAIADKRVMPSMRASGI